MAEIWHALMSVTAHTTYLVAGLTIICAYLFLHMTESRFLTLVFTPVAALGALLGIFLSREFGLYYSADEDSNVMLSSIFGLCISLAVVILTARVGFFCVNIIRNGQAKRLRQRRNG